MEFIYERVAFGCAFCQSFMWDEIRVAVSSMLMFRPNASTKLFSGSKLAISGIYPSDKRK